MNYGSPFDKQTATADSGRRRRNMLRLWLYLGVIAALGFGLYHTLFSPSSDTTGVTACLPPACVPIAEAKPRLASAPASAPAAMPCPYCNQSPDLWMSQTGVAPPEVGGKSVALLEGSCGRLIYGKAQDERHPPASLTKIVTALVARDSMRLSDRVPITINGWELSAEDESSIMGLEVGMELSVEELLYGLLLPSGNDAALALAERAGGLPTFVERMNQRVQKLGLSNSHFVNPDGRDNPNQYSSALDMAVLGRELMASPELRKIVGTQTIVPAWSGRTLWNANPFVYYYPGALGVKLGYTELANYTIVSAAQRDGRELFVAVMNSWNEFGDSRRLLDWAFDNTKPAC